MAENDTPSESGAAEKSDFIREIIREDLQSGKHEQVVTRFPPEPNGYLHIGHAKAFLLNFSLPEEFGGRCHLRFDDTNPMKEEQEYIDAIKEDLAWMGCNWGDHEYYASDYFQQLYDWAVELIKKGKAYVCELSPEQMREYRGTLTEPGKGSPWRDRPIEESLDLFERMRAGEFDEGRYVLRAKVDMASGNMNMRDPVMYRIMKQSHPRTGDKWCIYPMYDWAHGQSDSVEGITHSLCSLEFSPHRALYDWFLDALEVYHPRQYEFARLNLNYTVVSKRKLLALIESRVVDGWDDPRLPTLRGMRRRGYPSEAIRDFIRRIGMAKTDSTVDFALLEHCVREYLNKHAARYMGVMNPLKVVIENYPEGESEELEAVNNPEDPDAGTRMVPFSRTLYIERDDFMEDPPRKFFRLAPGREVRLRYAYFIKCHDVVKDDKGEIVELRCTYDPETRGGHAPDGRKVKATIHWVSAEHARDVEVRLYSHLFTTENPEDVPEGTDWKENVDANSLEIVPVAKIEPAAADLDSGTMIQFERLGYFCVDSKISKPGAPVFNRTTTLRDTWARIQKRG